MSTLQKSILLAKPSEIAHHVRPYLLPQLHQDDASQEGAAILREVS
jgi:hypothetical protein